MSRHGWWVCVSYLGPKFQESGSNFNYLKSGPYHVISSSMAAIAYHNLNVIPEYLMISGVCFMNHAGKAFD